jgi:hypothetical protein
MNKKIAMLLCFTIMFAGCTDLAEESTESDVFTTQDLDGIFVNIFIGLEVEMNADDTYEISLLEAGDCYETSEMAESAKTDLENMADDYYANGELIISDNCVFLKYPMSEEEYVTFNTSLISQTEVPYIEIIATAMVYEGEFTCDDGETIPADWVEDGEADCSGGEDEVEGVADSLEGNVSEIATIYLWADGFGYMNYAEGVLDDEVTCIPMSPPNVLQILNQGYDIIEDLSDLEQEEFDESNSLTYPDSLTNLFNSTNQNYGESQAYSSATTVCGDLATYPMMTQWLSYSYFGLAESNTDGSLALYTFSGADAPDSDGGVIMTMESGQDIEWAVITIRASVDGGSANNIPMCSEGESTDCWSTSDSGDTTYWNVGEAITVDTPCVGTCDVTITILNNREGTTLDTTNVMVE